MLYLDASAIVKLVRREPETLDLIDAVRQDPALVSSALSWTEVMRGVRRVGGDAARAEEVLGDIALVPIDDGIVRAAADLAPRTLRGVDAVHLATVLSLADDVDRLVTYDARLADAAAAAGIDVAAPGASQLV
ncbi:MAG: type II toxin-antitoxin system VapC family toxin [Actinomycetota bacterium]